MLTLVDSNVLLDVIGADAVWEDWSAQALAQSARDGDLCINAIVYAEVSANFATMEEADLALPENFFPRLPIPMEAAFLAGKAFVRYRRGGGTRTCALPDFFIGAHAAVANIRLLTRDAARYRTYFPRIEIICPSQQESKPTP